MQANFEPWLDFRQRQGRPVPRYVEDEFREYLECGDPDSGYTTWACPDGHFCRYVPAHCKGRGWCQSCLTVRQRRLGRHLIQSVLGNVSVRHVVLCFPPLLRYVLGYDSALLNGGYKAIVNAVFEYQRRKAVELFGVDPELVHLAAAATNHRVSATLDPNHHYHGIFPAGVFVQLEPDGPLEFVTLPRPSEDDIAGIAFQACLKFCDVLAACGFWRTTSIHSDSIDGLLTLPKRGSRKAKFFGQAARDAEGGVAPRDGAYAFHVFVGNVIEPEDRHQLQYLVDYILAPPFKDEQLTLDPKGNIILRLKRARHDGRPDQVFTPFQFLDRLADLVPRPNANTVRYFGVYAPNAKLRKQAISLHVEPGAPVAACGSNFLICPVCERKLRFISGLIRRRRTHQSIPPDTPSPIARRIQDRIGRDTTDAVQGRLFDNVEVYAAI